jgi:hypothetical protein
MNIELEKACIKKINYWTGLRKPIYSEYNWTLLFCLLYKTKNKVPLDGIMEIINQFLNYFPACIWDPTKYSPCCICLSPYWYNINNDPGIYCSYQCLEKDMYSNLMKDYNDYLEILELFNNDPYYAVYSLERYIRSYNYNYIPIEDYILYEHYLPYESDDSDEFRHYYNYE